LLWWCRDIRCWWHVFFRLWFTNYSKVESPSQTGNYPTVYIRM